MRIRKVGDRKLNIVVFQGSARDKDTCPNMESKTHKIVDHLVENWSIYADFEVIDLSVNQSKKPIIQPCKGCVSTAGGYHCHFQCSCYFKGNKEQPDLLKELDVYTKLKECDAFMVYSPIYWHSLSSQVKTLFDRLVCINQTLTVEDAETLMGKGNIKNHEITGELSKLGTSDYLLKNHLEGKYAAFYVHGDDGANDYSKSNLPKSYEPDKFSKDVRSVVEPFVAQLKYSGVFVPEELIECFYINKGKDYYTSNQEFDKTFIQKSDNLIKNLLKLL